jgi:hypothetical protein
MEKNKAPGLNGSLLSYIKKLGCYKRRFFLRIIKGDLMVMFSSFHKGSFIFSRLILEILSFYQQIKCNADTKIFDLFVFGRVTILKII